MKRTLTIITVVFSMILGASAIAGDTSTGLKVNDIITIKISSEENVRVVGVSDKHAMLYPCSLNGEKITGDIFASVKKGKACTLYEGKMTVKVVGVSYTKSGKKKYNLEIVSKDRKNHRCSYCPKGTIFSRSATRTEVVEK